MKPNILQQTFNDLNSMNRFKLEINTSISETGHRDECEYNICLHILEKAILCFGADKIHQLYKLNIINRFITVLYLIEVSLFRLFRFK